MTACKAMAALPTPKPTRAESFSQNPALAALRDFDRACLVHPLVPPVAVALSGGADSTALLLAAAVHWPGQVTALHIHHGLQAAGDAFEQRCVAFCHEHQVPLQVIRVNARHATGESPEDAARKARYAALSEKALALGIGRVLLGQHADDQVETLLLALSRGSGLPGMSAMPDNFARGGVHFYRPLLSVPAYQLRDWLIQNGHAFVDDPSNADEHFTRNRIRARLLPVLEENFPQFRQTFARSAQHAAQAQTLLDEVAADDLIRVGCPPLIATLQSLSRARQANFLRHWLARHHDVRASAAQLGELLDQVAACQTRGHRIHLKIASGHVALEAGLLHFSKSPEPRKR
jgi:tRNA(Ile)-lysidine synthase